MSAAKRSRRSEKGDQKPPDGERGRRKPGRVRRWLIRPVVWILVAVLVLGAAGLLYLSSDAFERRIQATVEARASAALGRAVTLEKLELHVLSLAADALGVKVAGPTPEAPPVLTVRRVSVNLSLLDLVLRGEGKTALRVEQLSLDRPRFELRYADDGTSNLPDFPGGDGEGARDGAVEMQLGRVLIQDGVFLYGDRRIPLALDARGVWGRLDRGAFDEEHPYRIRLSARSMESRWLDVEPVTPAVTLEGRLYPSRFVLEAGRLELPELGVELSGAMRWREPEDVRVDIAARGTAAWANRLGYLDQPVEGPVRVDGRFHWTPEEWGYGGELAAEHLDLLGRRFEDFEGQLTGDAEEVRVEVATARHAGGRLQGRFVLDLASPTAAGWPARIEARGEGLALRQVLDELGLELQGLAGRLAARLDYRFSTGALWQGEGEGQVEVGEVRRPSDRRSVQGRIPLRIDNGVLRLQGARLRTSSQEARVDLTYDLERRTGALRYRLETGDLAELASIPEAEVSPSTGPGAGGDGASGDGASGDETPLWRPTAGRGVVAGTLDLTPDRVLGRLTFDLSDVAAADLSIDRIQGSFDHSPARLSDLRLRAERGGGELAVTGEIRLLDEDDGGEESAGVTLDLDAAGWPLASLGPLVSLSPDLVEGGLNGHLQVSGPLPRPSVRGAVWAAPLRVADFVIDRADLELDWSGDTGRVELLRLTGAPGRLETVGTFDLETGEMSFRLEAPELALERSQTVAGLAGRLEGKVSLEASLGGTLELPTAELSLVGKDLALEGRPLGRRGTAELTAIWHDDELEAHGSLLGLVRFDGGGALDRESVDLDFRTASERVGEILELLVESTPALDGSFTGRLAVRGRWQEPTAIRGRLELSELALTYQDRQIRNLQPVIAEVGDGVLGVESLFLGSPQTGGELFVGGTVGLTAEDPPLDLRLQTSLAAVWLEPLLPDFQISGAFDALATVRGTATAPKINGQGEVRKGQVIVPGFPHSLEDASAIVFFYPEQVVLHQLTGRVAGGSVQATGRLAMPRTTDPTDQPLDYELQAVAKNLSLRYPEGWTVRGGAEISLRSPSGDGGRELAGTVTLDRAFYLQDVPVGLFQVIQGTLQRQRLALQETEEELAKTQLSLSIQGDEALRVRNNVADLSGDVSLTLQGTLARPVIFGQVEVVPGGTLLFRDTEYEVERGLLTFSNPYDIEPVIDLLATTRVRQYDVQLNLSGTLERLNANFSSNPPLADLEILGLLTTGAGPGERVAEGPVAERFLFGQAASAISRRVSTLFGFDRFRIAPGKSGEIASGIGLTVEKRLSREVTVIYSQDPTSTEREIVEVAWEVVEGITLILSRQGDGSFALDTRYERSF